MFLIFRDFFPGLSGRKNKRILHTAHVKYIHPFSTEKALDLGKLQYELYRNGKCWKTTKEGFILGLLPHPCESSWEYQKGSQFQRHLMQKKKKQQWAVEDSEKCSNIRFPADHHIFTFHTNFQVHLFHYCILRWLKHQKITLDQPSGINPWVGSQPLRPAGRFVLSEVVVSDGTAFFRLDLGPIAGPQEVEVLDAIPGFRPEP